MHRCTISKGQCGLFGKTGKVRCNQDEKTGVKLDSSTDGLARE